MKSGAGSSTICATCFHMRMFRPANWRRGRDTKARCGLKRSMFWARLDYRWYRVFAVAWMALIFYLSSQSHLSVPDLFDSQDKAEHFIAYGVLGFFLSGSFWQRPLRARDVLADAALTLLYGASDEFHQSFVPGRDASWLDLLADGVGGAIAAFMFLHLNRVAESLARREVREERDSEQ